MQAKPNTFSSYAFTREEELKASILTHLQKARIQSQLSEVAESILALSFDPLNPTKFAQDDAFLKGQLSILRVMLLSSDESEIQLQSLIASQSN